jgi:Spy/CpxP family protein refolding chaperone
MTRDNSLDLLHDARRATATAAAILALTLGVAASASAFGGPGGSGGHWGHGGPGRAGGPGDAFMGHALATLKPQLNLDPAQQQRFRPVGRAGQIRARGRPR